MSIIYSYPIKGTPANDDLILISDSASSPQFATKQIKVSSLPGGSASGVSSFNTLTGAVTITGGTNVTLNPVGNNIEINAAGGGGTPSTPLNSVQFNNASAFGGSANLTFTTNTLAVTHTLDIKGDGTNAGKLKLYCENTTTPHAVTIEGPAHSGATAYTLKLPSPAPANNQVLEYENSTNNLRWINTPSGSGSTSPAGSNTQIQYNNNGSFGASSNFTYTDSTRILTIGDQDVNRGIISIAGGSSGAGELRLGDPGTSGGTVTLKGGNDHSVSYTIKLPDDGPSTNNKILESDASGNLTWITTPTGINVVGNPSGTASADLSKITIGSTIYAIPTQGLTSVGLSAPPAFSVTGSPLTSNGSISIGVTGGTAGEFLAYNGQWATPTDTNTNIANTDLQLSTNRTLDLSNSDAADYALTFISTLGGASKNLFKFDQIGGTSPRFTAGHTESAYEGYVVLEGNGSNRTGQVQFENAAGTYYTSIKAPNTFGANQNIVYVLPDLQGAANSVLTNNGSGTLSWGSVTEEASWTPTSANANTISNASGKYTKVGNTVFASFTFTMSGSTSISLSGLPFSGVYTGANKGTSIISINNCASVQGQIVGGQMVAATSFTFNAYTGSGSGLPTKLQTTTSSMYQTAGGTYSGIIIYQTS